MKTRQEALDRLRSFRLGEGVFWAGNKATVVKIYDRDLCVAYTTPTGKDRSRMVPMSAVRRRSDV